ncbi:MAG: Fic family protein [Cyanobacteria bacterium P01_F01_bin.86]
MQGNYPHMPFQKNWVLDEKAWYLLGRISGIVDAICEVPILPDYRQYLLQVSLKKGAQATTAIEGNTLTMEEIDNVAAGKSLPPSKQYQEIEVRNVLNAMDQLLSEVVGGGDSIVTPALIKQFHKYIGADLGEHLDAIPGKFREDNRIVGTYRCPTHQDVPELVDKLCSWLREIFQYSKGEQPIYDAIIQAIVTHIYIEWIHPFGDGNGRTGRLLEYFILLRAGMPDIGSHILSNHYNETRSEYYRQIDLANKKRDLSGFINYALQGLHDGLKRTLEIVQAVQFQVAWSSYIYETFNKHKITKRNVLQRRRNLILSMQIDRVYTIEELSLLTPQVARDYATLSTLTMKRDLEFLEDPCGLIVSAGSKYRANFSVLLSSVAVRKMQTSLEEPGMTTTMD